MRLEGAHSTTLLVDNAQLILKYLKDVGIDAKFDQREYGAFIASCYFGKFDSMTYGPQTPFLDPDNFLYGMHYPGRRRIRATSTTRSSPTC